MFRVIPDTKKKDLSEEIEEFYEEGSASPNKVKPTIVERLIVTVVWLIVVVCAICFGTAAYLKITEGTPDKIDFFMETFTLLITALLSYVAGFFKNKTS